MSKKLLGALALVAMVSLAALPVLADETLPDSCIMRADPGMDVCRYGDAATDCTYEDGDRPCALCCLLATINYAVNWIFTFLVALAIILVLIGAYHILTAAGAQEKVTQGQNYIKFALIGLALALMAKAVPSLVKFIVGT